MKIGWYNGLHIRTSETSLIIDPTTSRLPKDAFVFISHAHSDHTKGFNSLNIKFSTYETRKIFESITERKVNNSRNLSINSYVKIDDLKVESLNSGYMIGASQFRIITPEKVILYTGDLNYVDSLVVEAAEPKECDVLIVEATYGDPLYNFPPKVNVYSDIIRWTLNEIKYDRPPCFRVYAAGKA